MIEQIASCCVWKDNSFQWSLTLFWHKFFGRICFTFRLWLLVSFHWWSQIDTFYPFSLCLLEIQLSDLTKNSRNVFFQNIGIDFIKKNVICSKMKETILCFDLFKGRKVVVFSFISLFFHSLSNIHDSEFIWKTTYFLFHDLSSIS
jgi:hypothetical protein